ncbi:hypothetical protein QPK87_18375 [Kamptonema cortianum]|nr:hypothetical protein [Geitlerinema splendidum]MDK3158524.1 hypothetical protein [Kamptonema cortianum]
MPRKKKEETEESPARESGKVETKSETKPARRRRTADEILKSLSETAETAPAPKKPAKPSSKSSRARKAAAKTSAPAEQPDQSEEKSAQAKSSAAKEVASKSRKTAPRAPRQSSTDAKSTGDSTKPSASRSRTKTGADKSESRAAASKLKSKGTDDLSLDGTFELNWRKPSGKPEVKSEPSADLEAQVKFRTKKDVSSRRGKQPISEITEEPPVTFEIPEEPAWILDDEESRVSVLLWRERTAKESPKLEKPYSVRKSRAKSEDSQDAQVGESAPVVETPTSEEEHKVRQPVPRSEESAQVAVLGGHPVLIRDKKVRPPIFFGIKSSQGGLSPAVVEQLKLASENGIFLFSLAVDVIVDSGKTKESVQRIEELVREVLSVHQDFETILRIRFVPPENWSTLYPNAVYTNQRGQIARPSLCDDDYWTEAEKCLEEIVRSLRERGLAKALLGVHVDRDDWVFEDGEGYDTSESGAISFRKWLRHKYTDVVPLRASWFDGSVDFETAEVPTYGVTHASEDFVRTDRKARPWIDYNLFLSDMIVDRIGQLCYAAKHAAEGDLVTGVSYGYTFEWSHPDSGHLSLGKLLRCPELDYVAGPPSYRDREPGGSAAFPFPVDSVALNGKLYLSEDDFRTPISRGMEPEDGNPLMKTPQALEHAQRRGAGGALAHNGGVIWFDSFGNGWLNSRGIWERAKEIQDALLRRLSLPPSDPDVAMFIDERSLSYLTDPRAFEVLVQQVREAMLRSGLSVGFYLLSDLAHRENFPESRLNVFVNAWDIRPEVRSAIKSRLQRNKKVLFWLYSAGLFEGGRESLERVREATGIPLRPQPFNCKSGTTLLNARDELSQQLPADELARGGSLEPSYFAIPEDATVLGEYIHTGLPSFVIRDFVETGDESWTSVFLGEPIVSPGLFRALAQRAEGHVWSYENDLVHVRAPFLSVHCNGTGQRTLMLPSKWVAYDLVAGEYMPVENSSIRFKAVDGETRMYVVGTLGDVQTYVNADTDSLRTILEPILRDENTLHWDTVKFDVKIMQLDEWVEETWSEELADDLLLKPSLIEDIDLESVPEEEEPFDSRGSGRRRRRRRKPRRDRGDQAADQAFGDTGVSVLFRKRD